ncbi:kinesin-like protein subito [Chrysoperla carnea]|uniref:kinesin-like protein subito n=1 Tax=Chrysoperla carnea TaxID=189513 RepID=UPI001D085D2E|nr:kinesin-like protein subito [Chrysoperla carnea]
MDERVKYLQARDPSIISGYVATTKITNKNIRQRKLLPLLNKLETQADSSMENESTNSTSVRDTKQFKVYLRIKPTENGIDSKIYKIDHHKNELLCQTTSNINCGRNGRKNDETIIKKYKFDKIFNDTVKQNEIFNKCVESQLYNLIYNDVDTNVMTYGASGSGKTHTILGDINAPGIIPRSLEYIFRHIKNNDVSKSPTGYMKQINNESVQELNREEYEIEYENTMKLLTLFWKNDNESHLHVKTYKAMENRISNEYDTSKSCSTSFECDQTKNYVYTVWISFFEIYNENVYDLLTFPNENDSQQSSLHHMQNRRNLKVIQDCKGNVHVKDLTTYLVKNGCDAYQLLQYGIHKIKYASTLINQHSSRSHCIFKVKLLKHAIQSDNQDVIISNISFIDLAGSERVKDTLNKGVRLKESNNINSSLMVLNRCLQLIHDKQHLQNNSKIMIPYRQSKLTQILKRALSGHELITMIVNIAPRLQMFETTQHVLQFSSIAKNIIVINSTRRLSKFTQYLAKDKSLTKSEESITSNGTTTVDYEQQIEYLLNENRKLKDFVQQQERIFEHRIQAEREEVVNEYNEILNDNEKQWEKRLQNAIERCKQRDTFNYSTITINSSLEESNDEETDNEEEQAPTIIANNKRSRICNTENLEGDTSKRTRLSEKIPSNVGSESESALIKKLQDELKYYKEIVADAKRDYEVLKSDHDDLTQKYVELCDRHLQCINNDNIVYDLSNENDDEESDNDSIISNISNNKGDKRDDDQSASINFSNF